MGAHDRLATVQFGRDVTSLGMILVSLVVHVDVAKFGRVEVALLSTKEEFPNTLSDLSSHFLGSKSITVFDLMLGPSESAELDRFTGHGR